MSETIETTDWVRVGKAADAMLPVIQLRECQTDKCGVKNPYCGCRRLARRYAHLAVEALNP